jgi:hypothetical protein
VHLTEVLLFIVLIKLKEETLLEGSSLNCGENTEWLYFKCVVYTTHDPRCFEIKLINKIAINFVSYTPSNFVFLC